MTTHEINAADDSLHLPFPGPQWLESFWFGFYDTDNEVGLVTLQGFNAREDRSRLWMLLVEGDAVTVDATDLQLPVGTPTDNGFEVGGLRVAMVEQQQEFDLVFEHPDASFDLRWSGTVPVKSTTAGHPFPGQQEQGPRGHSEQVGLVSGRFQVRDRVYEIDGARGWRDHLWGHAISDGWSEMGWWAWLTGTTVDGSRSFNCSAHRFPDGRTGFYGFMWVDGAIHKIHVHDCQLTTDPSGRHSQTCSARWTDKVDGVDYELTGEVIAPLWVEEPVPGGVCVINDPPARFSLNGEAAYGTIEMGDTFREDGVNG